MKIKIEQVGEIITGYFGKTLDEIRSTSRNRELVHIRFLCMYFMYLECETSNRKIGEYLRKDGKAMNHTTVLSGIRTIKDQLEIRDEKTTTNVANISAIISNYFSSDTQAIKDYVGMISTLLNRVPLFQITPCNTFGELAEYLSKKVAV